MEIKCENCAFHPTKCDREMMYGTCLTKGVCPYQGSRADGFHFSEFKPKMRCKDDYPKKEHPITLFYEDLVEIYEEAFKDGIRASQEGVKYSQIKAYRAYHPEWILNGIKPQ